MRLPGKPESSTGLYAVRTPPGTGGHLPAVTAGDDHRFGAGRLRQPVPRVRRAGPESVPAVGSG
ncbi:hypothetical protein CUT44_04955 [Streptomyces carminius]|uniref:Uncharacterized protein n=1 Tax=Streptomyces carminius TaxID=2665496 RepID=A0A2M8M5A9_9ACTN|nr:hypothetical protein CUT44_04955 [Streptomyces carminius]